MNVHFQEQTLTRIKQICRVAGIQEENLIQRAVLYYLDSIQKQVELKEEMRQWDQLSDEALVNFEQML